jgi:hypothetical protein
MPHDPLQDMPAESRAELTAAVCAAIDIDPATAEDIIRSTEPLWNAMERAGGLVDSWGGAEFCYVLPRVLTFIRQTANPKRNRRSLRPVTGATGRHLTQAIVTLRGARSAADARMRTPTFAPVKGRAGRPRTGPRQRSGPVPPVCWSG